jgi:hypothetical protein
MRKRLFQIFFRKEQRMKATQVSSDQVIPSLPLQEVESAAQSMALEQSPSYVSADPLEIKVDRAPSSTSPFQHHLSAADLSDGVFSGFERRKEYE